MSRETLCRELGDGNPGGETVAKQLMNCSRLSNGMILWMKGNGMMGSRLWCLYKYVCDQNLDMTYVLLKTLQNTEDPKSVRIWISQEKCVLSVIDFLEYMGT
jgi:hypothetical protein